MNVTPSPPIHQRQRHFVDCQGTRMTQMTKDFTMRHDENYVEYNSISIKSHQFVTNCPYQTIYSKHNICSYEFLWYDFTIVLPVDCAIKSGPRGCGKLTHYLFFSLILHNTIEIIIIIKWDVLLVEKIFLVTSSTGQKSPIGGM